VRPTRTPLLALLVVVAGIASYVFSREFYADVASPPRYAPLTLLLLAMAELYIASTTRARLAGRPGTKPINPLIVARLAALAKATSPVASIATGAYAGFLGYVAGIDGPQANRDVTTAAVGVATGAALLVAGLVLERVCRVKPPKDSDPSYPE
jgi:uncharacterized protein DUF3180